MSAADWLERRILVAVGTGGVGKTTLAAALAVGGAQRGKRVLVLTIDPARRLADALGVELSHTPRPLPRDVLDAAGVRGPGAIDAMMLDTKRTFDELLERYARDPEMRERVMANPIYRNLTDALAGSREYSAMEKLYQLATEDDYDLIVLDTPPAAHALHFLDAPRRLTGFLDSQLLRLLFRPALAMGRTGFRLFRAGSNLVLQVMERVTGVEFLRVVSEFLLAFESLWGEVATRAREIDAVLRDPGCGFVLVVGPDPVQARRAGEFRARLERERIRLIGAVLNRVRTWPGAAIPPPEALEAAAERLTGALRARGSALDPRGLVDAVRRQAALASRDSDLRARLVASLPVPPEDVRTVPLLDDEGALPTLLGVASHVFEEAPDARP